MAPSRSPSHWRPIPEVINFSVYVIGSYACRFLESGMAVSICDPFVQLGPISSTLHSTQFIFCFAQVICKTCISFISCDVLSSLLIMVFCTNLLLEDHFDWSGVLSYNTGQSFSGKLLQMQTENKINSLARAS